MKTRRLGTVLVVGGLLVLAYAAAVLFWRDPVTDVYNRYQQNKLESALEHEFEAWDAGPPPRSPTPETTTRNRQPIRAPRKPRLHATPAASCAGWSRGRRSADPHPANRGRNGRRPRDTLGADLSRGPGHYERTTVPGLGKTVGIAGHRTTFGAPFRKIDKIEVGDEMHAGHALRHLPLPRLQARDRGRRRLERDPRTAASTTPHALGVPIPSTAPPSAGSCTRAWRPCSRARARRTRSPRPARAQDSARPRLRRSRPHRPRPRRARSPAAPHDHVRLLAGERLEDVLVAVAPSRRSHELVAVGVSPHRGAELPAPEGGEWIRQAEERVDRGPHEQLERGEHRDGVSGEVEDQVVTANPEGHRLPRLHLHAPEELLDAKLGLNLADKIV